MTETRRHQLAVGGQASELVVEVAQSSCSPSRTPLWGQCGPWPHEEGEVALHCHSQSDGCPLLMQLSISEGLCLVPAVPLGPVERNRPEDTMVPESGS